MSLRALFKLFCLQSTTGFRISCFLIHNKSKSILSTQWVSGHFLNYFVSNQAEISTHGFRTTCFPDTKWVSEHSEHSMSLRALFKFVCLESTWDSTYGFRTSTHWVTGHFLNLFVSNQAEIQLISSEQPVFLDKMSLWALIESQGTF